MRATDPPAPAHDRSPTGRAPAVLAFAGLVLASILFRLPMLLNARGVHSDAAIVGLQARHMLRGEWSWILWGDGQQSSFDALVVALGFLMAGENAYTLMAVPLLGHLLLTWFVWDVARRRVGLAAATVACLAIVLGPRAITEVALYAPRQWCFTALAAASWLLDGAAGARRPGLRYGLGVALALAATALDLIAAAFLPALGLFAAACCLDEFPGRRAVLRRLAACGVGVAVGLLVAWLPRQAAEASTWKAGASPRYVPRNAPLLFGDALPWTLSARVLVPGPIRKSLYPWEPPAAFRAVQLAGAGVLVLGLLSGAAAAPWRRVPWEVRRTGLLGATITAGLIAAYLVSVMPGDPWSVRYLGPIIWSAPWALAPAAYLLGARRLGLVLVPYFLAAAAGGWVSYGPYVRGPRPVLDPRGVAADEDALGAELARLGVDYALADYWVAYRLSFLLRERLIATPLSSTDVRYGPYLNAVGSAPILAYVFHPQYPGALADSYEHDLRASGVPLERREIAGFTVLLLRTTSYHYEDPRGTGRLTLVDLGPGPEPGTRRLRVALSRDGGERHEGTGLRRTIDRVRPFAADVEFTLDDGRIYHGRILSPHGPYGSGTSRPAGPPGPSTAWRINRMERK